MTRTPESQRCANQQTRLEQDLALRCVAWMEGYLDRLKAERYLPPNQSSISIPKDVSIGRLVDVFLRYVSERPDSAPQKRSCRAPLVLRCPIHSPHGDHQFPIGRNVTEHR
jgi:hypothetical protein